jgi:ribose/xylose/arabinose/galactoside ABC-type transport system permease subunit
MNRNLFIITLVLITIMTLAASLPERFYQPDAKLFVKITIAFTALGLLALGMYFYI